MEYQLSLATVYQRKMETEDTCMSYLKHTLRSDKRERSMEQLTIQCQLSLDF